MIRLARFLKRYRILIGASLSDLFRYGRHSLGREDAIQESVKGELLKVVHSLEKGLIMPGQPRVFGQEKMIKTKKLLSALSCTAENQWVRDYADRIMASVVSHNEALSSGVQAALEAEGVVWLEKADVAQTLPATPEAFFGSRRSVREYAEATVSSELLARAVKLAQRAPSVCNRQSGRVRFYTSDEDKTRLFKLQSGNGGFGHMAPVLAIVSSDIRSFLHSGERNQCFVDGGLFAMALAMALHSIGLGSCMLNWSVNPARDLQLRKAASIPDHEVVIMMMSIGHLRPRYKVAESHRRPLDEVWLNKSDDIV